jgi:two-component system response regulator PilR (NtrC family)
VELIGENDLHLGNAPIMPENRSSGDAKPAENSAGQANVPEGEIDLEGYLETVERSAIEKALEATRWNKTAAAKRLGISFRALRYKLKKLEME